MPLLTDAQTQRFLTDHPGWKREGKELQRTFDFSSFREAVGFVNRVAEVAEAHNHHPDLDLRFKKVTVRLISHDAGGLTERDSKLAAECEAAFRAKRP
jgi:4a-hydroxytetrahydrobiopterin dehydratase